MLIKKNKNLYEVGEIPDLGVVPKKMYAWTVRRERHGKPEKSFQPKVNNLFTNNIKRGCEWPEGHPDESDFKFCGKERFEDKPYCLKHCAVAYVIPEKEESEKEQISNSAR